MKDATVWGWGYQDHLKGEHEKHILYRRRSLPNCYDEFVQEPTAWGGVALTSINGGCEVVQCERKKRGVSCG